MSKKIAFASIDGAYVDQHFGSARTFQIYETENNEYRHLETRKTQSLCKGSCDGGFSHLYEALRDCDAVFVLKIGEGAAAYMIGRGKRVFEASGPVEEIIEQVLDSDLLDGE